MCGSSTMTAQSLYLPNFFRACGELLLSLFRPNFFRVCAGPIHFWFWVNVFPACFGSVLLWFSLNFSYPYGEPHLWWLYLIVFACGGSALWWFLLNCLRLAAHLYFRDFGSILFGFVSGLYCSVFSLIDQIIWVFTCLCQIYTNVILEKLFPIPTSGLYMFLLWWFWAYFSRLRQTSLTCA